MKREELQDGTYLKQLLVLLDRNESKENYLKVINCLRDSILWEKVPVTTIEEDEYCILNSKGERISALNSMYYEMMTTEHKNYLVFYSTYSKGIDEDGAEYTMHDLPMLNRIVELISNEEFDGFVIDPQDNHLVFDLEDCKRIVRAPGVLEIKEKDLLDYLQYAIEMEHQDLYNHYLYVLQQFARMGMSKAIQILEKQKIQNLKEA